MSDKNIEYLNNELHEWWNKAHADFNSGAFRGPDSDALYRDALNMVASATKLLTRAAENSFVLEKR